MNNLLWLLTAGVVALFLIVALVIFDPATKPSVDTETTRERTVLS